MRRKYLSDLSQIENLLLIKSKEKPQVEPGMSSLEAKAEKIGRSDESEIKDAEIEVTS